MKTIDIQIEYATKWGQSIGVKVEPTSELRIGDEGNIISLVYANDEVWRVKINIPKANNELSFRFCLLENNEIIKEETSNHKIILPEQDSRVRCYWQNDLQQSYFNLSPFANSIFKQDYQNHSFRVNEVLQFVVFCVHVESTQELVMCGSTDVLGGWEIEKALALTPVSYGRWAVGLSLENLSCFGTYKLAIRDKKTKEIIEWEDGENRTLRSFSEHSSKHIVELLYRKSHADWRTSGVVIPIFSLRSEKSFGVGEFSDLELLADWGEQTKMRVIQMLPINDTTASYSWCDSYPYNAISIYALHPLYLGLYRHPLADKNKNSIYRQKAEELNALATLDYEKVIRLKTDYIEDLFNERGREILNSKEYKEFYNKNEEWLFPYACFCFLRDKNNTAKFSDWGIYAVYDSGKLEELLKRDKQAKHDFSKACFTQYLLHQQLTDAKQYAYSKGIVLKGDIPIGISHSSVEAWKEPHLFNMDTQTGAPPDAFSTKGQNWGFPTYNWAEMKKDNYGWWTRRFVKMTDYFDVYRIDHILGFFRIWEIPETSVEGLLGYFNPALPLLPTEAEGWGLTFDEEYTVASIHQDDLIGLFGEYVDEVKGSYLVQRGESYTLKEEVRNQQSIRSSFEKDLDQRSQIIRDGLYEVCNEVLFVRDKYQKTKFHPRIELFNTLRYKRLNTKEQDILYRLHEYYFFNRHTEYWGTEAMSKLPTLINSTKMLVCGEDLGMVPDSVHPVMEKLEILTLEIQRMPKLFGVKFSDLSKLPYLCVATTSTHDMSPLRVWWEEDADDTQHYYNDMLGLKRKAPKDCLSIICLDILRANLDSPAMLVILPLQDWLSVSDKVRRKNAGEERINVPSDPHNNWNYRMHITLEDLLKEKELSETIYFLNKSSGR